ncbi:DUF2357 domain-containing protein [Dialister succinatiphilus]|uniref:DUF2357 domain-containing protein n=1 Tax=Dialister succinatiphilus YIT 11850 TaxID=742743 RepID=H1D0S9_9FIRM|nr:DUF2357 domain-containing protein [Dialister succinatiphilus]EHO62874.1 hypothetical protein HMPREF9453_01217 [Dialister succinatiphilus YIT 11850]
MITPSKLPFTLTFSGGWDKGVRYFNRFTDNPEELAEDRAPGLTFTENQDIYIRFDAPRGFRFTMDGLDVVTIPGEERENGQTYIAPFRRQDQPLLLFEGQDFPLVPGYYVLTVEGGGRSWYGLMEITPKYMGKQSWQDMRDELTDEIRTLSFDFMKKNIHISKALEGALGLNTSMLLRFYTISSESSVVLSVLDELSHTANARMVLRLKQIRQEEGRRPDPHIRPQHVKERPGAERMPALRTEITRDVEENRFAKSILLALDHILQQFLEEIDGPIRRLEEKQAELRKYTWGLEYKTGEKALSRLSLYRRRARRIKDSISRVSRAPWFEEAGTATEGEVPMTVFMDPRYSVLYRLYKNLSDPAQSLDVSSFYQFQWKRTDKLYEMWSFLQFIKALTAKGWELEEGISVIREEGRYRLSSLESGTEIKLRREGEEVHLTYDGILPASSADTDRENHPLYTNNSHRQPDLRLDYYKGGLYYGSLVADFKYRDILFLWQDETRSASLRRQFNAYRDMNTRFYRDLDETASLRDSRPVKEVWAVFPREIPGKSDEDYSLRFIPLAPGLTGNHRLAEELENYLTSLSE